MNLIKNRCRLAGLWMFLGAGAALVLLAGWNNFGPARPTSVVSVNLAVLLEKLDQRSEADRRIEKMRSDLKDDSDKRQAELDTMKADAKKLQDELEAATDPKHRDELIDKLDDLQGRGAEARLKYEAWYKIASAKLDIELSTAFQDIFRSIKLAASDLAKSNGYDVVFIDDSARELHVNPQANQPRIEQVQQQLADRRSLYVNPELDVTELLVVRMNNANKTAAKPNP